jgi:hypothetical protein
MSNKPTHYHWDGQRLIVSWMVVSTIGGVEAVRSCACADAELMLRAYEAWGKKCLAHIDDDFALVIWDQRPREAMHSRPSRGTASRSSILLDQAALDWCAVEADDACKPLMSPYVACEDLGLRMADTCATIAASSAWISS